MMGQYTQLLQLKPSELAGLKREELYIRFYPADGAAGDHLIDLDKSLPGIQFLLSGNVDSENPYQNLLNGEIIPPSEEEGTGVTYHILTPVEIEKLDRLLLAIDDSDFQQNYDPLVMMASNVYPDIWANGRESYDYLYTHFRGLKSFISKAAYDSNVIVVMTT
ncbi:DUF1877 family protein [Chryseobacterium viscerum]|uniref:DUF1877 domain-containing protein n=1 Tax=Chryseobacterium viscerum TaxID=1037377 RepID=A0A316WV10_9FLAO|nr:DUF1877 family protein [Chryseobacterium viscerum]PWN64133.1 DUF1877 domain-containing protein [Chryseobacterium viscerum]